MSLDLSRPVVYLITKGDCGAENYMEASQRIFDIASVAVASGVDLIQLREKRLTGSLLFGLTQRLAAVTRGSRTKLLVNDRLDIALAAGADGVHLAASSVSAAAVRTHVSESFVIGASCHLAEDVAGAREGGATFALYGPVFASPGKGNGTGLDDLRGVCGKVNGFPVLATGGIDEKNYKDVVGAGAAGFAAIRALNDVASMRRILEGLAR